MKKLYILTLVLGMFGMTDLWAQCTNTVIDWDYREFFARNNNEIRNYVSLAQSQSQIFAIGANKATITHNYSTNSAVAGENTSHTGETGSYGTGADVEFTGDGIVTITFQTAVTNLKFSLYDVDRNQRVQFAALNGATPLNIGLTTVTGTSVSLNNNNTTSARADGGSGTEATTSSDGTVNVDIAGPVTSVTMTITNTGTCGSMCGGGGTESGEFWISDITACVTSTYPANYYVVSRPFTGMPSYVIVVRNNIFYYLDPATGNAKYLFQDNSNPNMNSLAYDPYNRLLYYTKSLSNSGNVNPNEKSLRRYSVDMDTFGVAYANVNNLGIPTFGQGVESGAAGFYNGHLYWGIEGHGNSNIESIIYRVELNASQLPIAYSQVYAQDAYNSGQRLHDWADFGLNNGILYDFDGGVANSPTGQNVDFYTQNLVTGVVTRYAPFTGPPLVIPRQTCIDWNGNIYNMGSAGQPADLGGVALYNGTNNTGTIFPISQKGVNFVGGSWGDGSEAFRPLVDYGDAPSTYDPVLLTAAVNERDTALRLGSRIDIEWLTKGQTALANSDSYDDGVATVRTFSNLYSTYSSRVVVHNNTGANATVMGWLDWNGNGVFDAGEASAAVTVPTGATPATQQTINLAWTGISSTLTTGSFTFLRIRVTSAVNSLTSAKATGWLADGETEDYRVVVNNIVLPITLLTFDAKASNNSTVKVNWSATEDVKFAGYEIQRSHNGTEWERIGYIPASETGGIQQYEYLDSDPYKGSSKYRLKMVEIGAAAQYSDIRTVKIADLTTQYSITPNPANTKATLSVTGDKTGEIAQVKIMDSKGNELSYQKVRLSIGTNQIELPLKSSWPVGTYLVVVTTDAGTVNNKLLISR